MSTWFQRMGVAALILLALYLRFVGLDEPNYWYDEAITSLRVAGHTEQEVAAYAESRPFFPMGDLEQFVSVDGSRGISDTLRSVKTEDAQHTPLFYMLARIWAGIFGSSIEASRALPALWSLLALPAMYWLCFELFVKSGAFESRIVCWLGVLAVTISPYQVGIAREYREYSMWSCLLIVACATFLRAVRVDTWAAWLWFAIAMIFAMYTHLLSALPLAACGVYLVFRERFRPSKTLLRFVVAAGVCAVTLAPWALILLGRQKTAQDSLSWVQAFSEGAYNFGFSIDPVARVADVSLWELRQIITRLPGLRYTILLERLTPIVLLAAVWVVAARSQGRARALVQCAGFSTALVASASLSLFVLDYVEGSTTGWAYRYHVSSNLGWMLVVVFLLASAWIVAGKWSLPARVISIVFLLVAFTSAVLDHEMRHTWAKAFDQHSDAVDFLNTTARIGLVSDDFVGGLISLSRQVRPDLMVSWKARCFSCPRAVEPLLEIPYSESRAATVYFFRSWVNVPIKRLRPLLADLVDDRAGDARFHTHLAGETFPQGDLFLLAPK
jgi:uncharacterized membrane protein